MCMLLAKSNPVSVSRFDLRQTHSDRTPDRYESACMFPPPPALIDTRAKAANPGIGHSNAPAPDRDSRLRPVDLHFLKDGRQLLASYLAHGVVCVLLLITSLLVENLLTKCMQVLGYVEADCTLALCTRRRYAAYVSVCASGDCRTTYEYNPVALVL